MLKKIVATAASLAFATSMMMAATGTAQAGRHHPGAVVGGAALGLFALGAMSAGSRYDGERCYRGPRECHWVRGACYRDRFGDVECEEGHERCYRPRYCD